MAPPIDADEPSALTWDEAGGTTVEYQTIFNADPTMIKHQARVTSYYWKAMTTGYADPHTHRYPLAAIPGCTRTGIATATDDTDDIFPWGMGKTLTAGGFDHTYLDVGTIQVTGGASAIDVPAGVVGMKDGESRVQDGTWRFFVNPLGGDTFLDKNDATYSLVMGGSAEWPAQTYTDAFYMPPAFTLNGFSPQQLVADTDFVDTWTPPTPANLPEGASIVFVHGFIVNGVGPVVLCVQDTVSAGQFTVPKETVNFIRSVGAAGVMGRALLTHRVQEFTDGNTHDHRRMDFITKWCYVSPWTAAP